MTSRTERLRRAFLEACEQHDIRGEVGGETEGLDLTFRPQEGADAALMLETFRAELQQAGTAWDEVADGRVEDDAATARAEDSIRTAVARMRVLLIEFNSYLSGGLTWPFGSAPTILRERGLAKYRFPARARVDVIAEADHARITVHRGDLGEVTSSGFYVPTLVRGDFVATLRYRLLDWQPGEASVCLALFAQDLPSRLRYYAQRRASLGTPHELLANFSNEVFGSPVPVAGSEGAFRLERRGDLVRSLHRDDAAWTVLGEHRGDTEEDVTFGSKIWSSGRAGPFDAKLFDLSIEGEFPAEQIPPVPVRPDPLAGSGL